MTGAIQVISTERGTRTMGLGEFSPQGEEEGEASGKSTYITFKNPRTADISDGSEHRHKEDYYDAVQSLRNKLGQDINVIFGEFAHAADQADKGNNEPLQELFNKITS